MQAFTFQRCEAANELSIPKCRDFAIWVNAAIHIHHEIRSILVLSGALGTGYCSILEYIHPLAAEHSVMVSCGQSVGDILLIPNPVTTVLGLTVDGITSDAENRFLLYQRHIVASSTHTGRHSGNNLIRVFVSCVNPVVFIKLRFLSLFRGNDQRCIAAALTKG